MFGGICLTALCMGGVSASAVVAPYAEESLDRWQSVEGGPVFAYHPYAEPGARALAAYLIALQIEGDSL